MHAVFQPNKELPTYCTNLFSVDRSWQVKRTIKSTAASTTTKNSSSQRIPPWATPPLAWSGECQGDPYSSQAFIRYSTPLNANVVDAYYFLWPFLTGKDQSEPLNTWEPQSGGTTSRTSAKITRRLVSVVLEVGICWITKHLVSYSTIILTLTLHFNLRCSSLTLLDSCKFLHDRSDYKHGWQIERELEEGRYGANGEFSKGD